MYQDPTIRVKTICAQLGIKPPTLYDRLDEMGVPTRQKSATKGKRLTPATIKKIYSMHVAGSTSYAIAKKLGIAPATVKYHLNKGIPAELYTPPVQAPMVIQTIVSPSLWSRIKGWFK